MHTLNLFPDPITEPESQIRRKRNQFNASNNKLNSTDMRFHDWYRFVLSFPAHLVRKYLGEFCMAPGCIVLDPFCGTGTTMVEAKLNGYESIGIEANPFAHFASSTKLNWNISADELLDCGREIAERVRIKFSSDGIIDDETNELTESTILQNLPPEKFKLILGNSISPVPLHKTLILLEEINRCKGKNFYSHLLLAFAKSTVFCVSNLKFGPEVGVGKIKQDAPVIDPWLFEIRRIANDLRSVANKPHINSVVYLGDSRQTDSFIKPGSIDAVITSPPYPNEKDYTRTTRLELVLLGFINNKDELRQFKKTLIRSNTRGVYKEDDDHQWISHHSEIMKLSEQIEKRRIELQKTSGFERLYGKVTQLYFGGIARHLRELQTVLKPGARLAYVVGDQASYLRVMIRTGNIIADIARELGYTVDRIDLFRTRPATVTGEQLREEVVVMTWGDNSV